MDDVKMTAVTQELLDINPQLVEQGVEVGDEVPIEGLNVEGLDIVEVSNADEASDEDDDSVENEDEAEAKTPAEVPEV